MSVHEEAASRQGLRSLPDSARIWVFGADRELDEHETGRLLEEVNDFLAGWKAHGHPLAAGREWRDGRFLLVGVDETVSPPSGCSIDALVRRLTELEAELGLQLVGGGPVFYRSGGVDQGSGSIRRVGRSEFRAAAKRGEVTPATQVFDLSLTRMGQVRAGEFERPAGSSWHSALLP